VAKRAVLQRRNRQGRQKPRRPQEERSTPDPGAPVRAGEQGWCRRSNHPAPPARTLRKRRRPTAQALTVAYITVACCMGGNP